MAGSCWWLLSGLGMLVDLWWWVPGSGMRTVGWLTCGIVCAWLFDMGWWWVVASWVSGWRLVVGGY